MQKRISILIPTMFDSRYIIELCLVTIRKYSSYPYNIIVGNNGVDEETMDFLRRQNDIRLVTLPKDKAAKDALAELVDTYYYLILHDDTQILKKEWLEKRVAAMERSSANAIVGPITLGYCYDWKSKVLSHFNRKLRRFFPLGMLVKTAVASELGLKWGAVIHKYDTGGLAYQQFCLQKKYRFVEYPFKHDIRHFAEMSWPIRNKIRNDSTLIDLDRLIEIRKHKIAEIKTILATGYY